MILESTESPGVELADNGLGGWLTCRCPCFGGCGKAPMLTVLRSDFPGGRGPTDGGSALGSTGKVDDEFVFPLGDGRWGNAEEEETARIPEGDESIEFETAGGGRAGDVALLWPFGATRVLGTGSDGRGPVGGAIEGLDGRGSVVAMTAGVCIYRNRRR